MEGSSAPARPRLRFALVRRCAVWRLRVPLVLLVAWGLFLIFDPTGQSPDTFRRWFDDWGRFAVSAGCTLGAAALLGLLTWTTARRRCSPTSA
jgi:hypothetical protein